MKNILVINALNGSLPLVLRETYPSAKITCAEVFPFFKDHLSRMGFDVVDWKHVGNMKFDLVIGNPPYQSVESKRIKLWQDFLQTGLGLVNDTGYLCFVTPNSWLNQDITIAKQVRSALTGYHISYLNKNTDEWFNVGESTCAFSVTKSKPSNYNGEKIFLDNQQVAIDAICKKLKTTDHTSAKTMLRRLYSSPHPRQNTDFSSQKISPFVNPVVHSATETWYTQNNVDEFKGHNVIINNSGYYYHNSNGKKYLFYSNTHVAGGNAFQITFSTKKQAQNAISFLTTKLYRFFVDNTKSGGFNATALYQLPILDTNRAWTDQLVYEEFGLSDSEVKLVESSFA